MNCWFTLFMLALACLPAAMVAQVQLGNEVLATNSFKELAGKRIGLLTNPSGVSRKLDCTMDVLRNGKGVRLVALFGAEHGFYGDVPAGEEIKNATDARTRFPGLSLYGPRPTRKPTPGTLRGVDA